MGWKFNFGRPYEITGKKENIIAECEEETNIIKNKRWGKPFKDGRNWVKYNEELVVRGEFILELDWVKVWDKELEAMNADKKGHPYQFPESLIKLQGLWHQWVDYRGIEGITRKLAEHGLVPTHNDFSTISRRVNRLDVGFNLPRHGSVSVSCDGSGMKMTNSGEYRQDKYGKKQRKWLRVKITADPKTRTLLACDVCVDGEGISEPDTAIKHVHGLVSNGIRIKKLWGDGGYDKRELFNMCQRNRIETAIKLPKNATDKARGSMRRSREVMEYRNKGYRKWADEKEYGIRWVGTEGIFSAVKRKFGENNRSRKLRNIFHEAQSKFWAYERMKSYAKEAVM